LDLYLLRHGEAGNRVPIAARDNERALTAAGRNEIEDVGEAMADMKYEFDVVASSPLKRALDTAGIVNKELKRRIPVEEWSELSPEGSRDAFYRRLAKLKAGTSVLIVGHEPYLTTVIGEVTGRDGSASPGFRIALKKGGLAKLTVDGFTPGATGELRWLLTPKQIRKMG
jgi:phosphohistidine phosphatase